VLADYVRFSSVKASRGKKAISPLKGCDAGLKK